MVDVVSVLKSEVCISMYMNVISNLSDVAAAKRAGLPSEGGHETPLFSLSLLQVYTLFGMLLKNIDVQFRPGQNSKTEYKLSYGYYL